MCKNSRILSILRGAVSVTVALLAVELLDELVFGTREAAWPLIRADLRLSYTQVGLLLAIPGIVSGVIEPVIGVLGDTRHRRALILAGGVAFCAALLLAAAAQSMVVLLLAFAVLYPASGSFVSLSQATLMDANLGEHERAMARWTLAGSVGVVAGPVLLAGTLAVGGGWRLLFVAWAALAMVTVAWLNARSRRNSSASQPGPSPAGFPVALRDALSAARRRETWRWLLMLACSDLLLDVLLGFLALYLVASTNATPSQAGLAVSVMAITGLAGDALIIVLLRHIAGCRWVRASAVAAIPTFLLFLAVPGFWPKVSLLVVVGLLNSGWYAVLKAQLYASLPGRSGAVMSISAVFDLATALIPALLGVVASKFGISVAMVILVAGPVGLALGVPASQPARAPEGDTVAPSP